jgi:hypothetical protein
MAGFTWIRRSHANPMKVVEQELVVIGRHLRLLFAVRTVIVSSLDRSTPDEFTLVAIVATSTGGCDASQPPLQILQQDCVVAAAGEVVGGAQQPGVS